MRKITHLSEGVSFMYLHCIRDLVLLALLKFLYDLVFFNILFFRAIKKFADIYHKNKNEDELIGHCLIIWS